MANPPVINMADGDSDGAGGGGAVSPLSAETRAAVAKPAKGSLATPPSNVARELRFERETMLEAASASKLAKEKGGSSQTTRLQPPGLDTDEAELDAEIATAEAMAKAAKLEKETAKLKKEAKMAAATEDKRGIDPLQTNDPWKDPAVQAKFKELLAQNETLCDSLAALVGSSGSSAPEASKNGEESTEETVLKRLDRKDVDKPDKYGGNADHWIKWSKAFKKFLKP
jgi:hypothetical protein